MALLRGAALGGEAAHRGFLALPCAEIPGLFRARAAAKWRALSGWRALELRRSVAVPDRRRVALCFPEAHEALREKSSGRGCTARARCEAPAHQSLYDLETAHPVQPVGHLSLLQGA